MQTHEGTQDTTEAILEGLKRVHRRGDPVSPAYFEAAPDEYEKALQRYRKYARGMIGKEVPDMSENELNASKGAWFVQDAAGAAFVAWMRHEGQVIR